MSEPKEPVTVVVPPGEALLGDPPSAAHVQIFAIAPKPVSRREYAEFASASGRVVPREGADEDPVRGVSWPEAVAYCQWLSRATGKTFRLPDEREWEKAARAGVLESVGSLVEWTNTYSSEGGRVLRGGPSLTARRFDGAEAGFRVVHTMTGR